jgi:hypothetical protein
MKTLIAAWARPSFLFILSVFVLNAGFAQSTKKEKAAKKTAEIKSMVEAKDYLFKAEYAQPMRGGNRYITPEYDFKVVKDSLIAYLPYFGRAYVAPMNTDDAGMKFTATHFDYKMVESKNGWDISIKPKDAKDVQSIQLSISKDGYATLRITSMNRDPISYQGYIQLKKQKG